MANTKPYEIIAGPLGVAFAATETAFPALSAYSEVGDVSGTIGAWQIVGYTEGGVKVGHPQTVVELRADQVTGPIKAVRSEEALEITFSIATVSLDNYALALNQAIAGPTGNKVKLYRGGFQVETLSMVFYNPHLSPLGDFPLAYEVPVCFVAGDPELEYVKDNKAVLAVSFHALMDPLRATDADAFGQLNVGAV